MPSGHLIIPPTSLAVRFFNSYLCASRFFIVFVTYPVCHVGAAFLALCDAAARSMLPGRELPVGLVTAALGAPLLVYLVARERR